VRLLPRLFALSIACFFVAASCDHAAPATPVVASSGPARRIVCTNAAATEFVARLVAPERLAGVPEQVDTYASIDMRSGGFEKVPRFSRYVAEPILVLAPDLVVTHVWQSADTTSVLRARGIEVVVLQSAQSFDDIRRTLEELGKRLGATDEARRIVSDLDARVAKLREGAKPRAALAAMVYANDGTGGTTAGLDTTIDTMFALAGVRNAAGEAGIRGHQPIEFERLIAIDPDVLVVSAPAHGEGGSATKSVVESSAPLAGLKARKPGRIIVLPAQLTSADSPPLVDAAELLAREIDRILAQPK
jgi:iron complex transport system substrate-binding protein